MHIPRSAHTNAPRCLRATVTLGMDTGGARKPVASLVSKWEASGTFVVLGGPEEGGTFVSAEVRGSTGEVVTMRLPAELTRKVRGGRALLPTGGQVTLWVLSGVEDVVLELGGYVRENSAACLDLMVTRVKEGATTRTERMVELGCHRCGISVVGAFRGDPETPVPLVSQYVVLVVFPECVPL